MIYDQNKISFIICVNDEDEYAECRYYLDRLQVPEGYHTDVIEIWEARSMTSGYNAGMRSSDAKYKVYLHQDVFIINPVFLEDLLKVFACDERIGLIGMIGTTEKFNTRMEWNAGKVLENRGKWDLVYPSRENFFVEVQAVDGLLLATQYDLPWREDLFDGWDFYDISQTMEFKRAGYKTVVPWQKEAWCGHDNTAPNLTKYFDYYDIYVHEYGEMAGFSNEKTMEDHILEKEYAQQMVVLRKSAEELFSVCSRKERNRLREVFWAESFRGYQCLWEYALILYIDWLEEQNQSKFLFWEEGMSATELLSKFRNLRHLIKRLEYGTGDSEKKLIYKNFSGYAVYTVCEHYVLCKDKVYRKLGMERHAGENV